MMNWQNLAMSTFATLIPSHITSLAHNLCKRVEPKHNTNQPYMITENLVCCWYVAGKQLVGAVTTSLCKGDNSLVKRGKVEHNGGMQLIHKPV